MPTPSSALSTLRPDLASSMLEFDLDMNMNRFGGLRIAPPIEVDSQSGNFGKIPIEQLLKARDTKRAPGSGYSRSNFKFDPASYACDEHGAEEPIDDRERRMYRDYFDAELVGATRARSSVMLNFEQRVCDLASDPSIWTGAALTTAVATPWTTVATATPVDNVRAARLAVFTNSGLIANALIISWARFQSLKDCAQVIDRVKYSGRDDPKSITPQALAALFDLDEIIIAGGVKDSALEGQTSVPASIWTDSRAMVCRVARTTDPREPCICRTFHWAEDGSAIGGVMETYRDETVRGDIVRARMDTDEVRMYVEAGHLLTSV